MKFNFKIQQYQTDAVDSVVNCFNGQPYIDNVSYRRDIGNVRQMITMSNIIWKRVIQRKKHYMQIPLYLFGQYIKLFWRSKRVGLLIEQLKALVVY